MAFFHKSLREGRLAVNGRMVPIGSDGRLEGEFSPEEIAWMESTQQFTEISEPKAKPAPPKPGAGEPVVSKPEAKKKSAPKKAAAKKKPAPKKKGA